MEIRAYDESYVQSAQNVLGHAVDFAVMTLEISPEVFGNAFCVSNASKQFAIGNPRYVAGMNGCELARLVLEKAKVPFTDTTDAMYLDKSPEYWAGWALAYYQWFSGRSFMDIFKAVSLNRLIEMYSVYHEMDISHMVEKMDGFMKDYYPFTRLRTRRENCGLSQSQLAADSGVALRQIQLFEQKQRDINKTAGETLLRLSRSLHCRMEDLMEFSST